MPQVLVYHLGVYTVSCESPKCGEHSLGYSVNARIGMTGSTGSHVCNGNLKMAGHIMNHELRDALYSLPIKCRGCSSCKPQKLAQEGHSWLRILGEGGILCT